MRHAMCLHPRARQAAPMVPQRGLRIIRPTISSASPTEAHTYPRTPVFSLPPSPRSRLNPPDRAEASGTNHYGRVSHDSELHGVILRCRVPSSGGAVIDAAPSLVQPRRVVVCPQV
ncbi:hypothetical protein BJV77DRAFT_221698 [Russula vinacea]|nr:hypothetical protein BJV77DRAFT_221698 [Russula vinacea]